MVRIKERGNVSIELSELTVLTRLTTKQHRVVVYRHPHLGRVLVLNGEIQHVEAWAPLYHEPLVHLPVAYIEKPRSALLIGGGSFFAARELLRYRTIERVTMVDYDPRLLDVMTRVYAHAVEVRNDPRLELRTVDAFSAITRMAERFDLVINDSVDLFRTQGPGVFSKMARLLGPKGVCSDLVYRHIFEDRFLRRTICLLTSKFHTVMALVCVPEYPGILHLLTLWGWNSRLNQKLRRTLNREQREWASVPESNPCEYFDPRFLNYYLYLPRHLRRRVFGVLPTSRHA